MHAPISFIKLNYYILQKKKELFRHGKMDLGIIFSYLDFEVWSCLVDINVNYLLPFHRLYKFLEEGSVHVNGFKKKIKCNWKLKTKFIGILLDTYTR